MTRNFWGIPRKEGEDEGEAGAEKEGERGRGGGRGRGRVGGRGKRQMGSEWMEEEHQKS